MSRSRTRPDDDLVVTAGVLGFELAVDVGDRVVEHRRTGHAAVPRGLAETVGALLREQTRQRLVVFAEHVDRELAGALDARPRARRVRDAEQHERRLERHRRERVAAMPTGSSPSIAVMIVTPVAKCPNTSRNRRSSGVTISSTGRSAIVVRRSRRRRRALRRAAITLGPADPCRQVAGVAQDLVDRVVAVRGAVVEQRELAAPDSRPTCTA